MIDTEKKYCYAHPHPAVTVDVVCLYRIANGWEVLLVRRGKPPCKDFWALPGGYIGIDEELEEAARRELYEETGLKIDRLDQLHTFGQPDRDPRERTISVAFLVGMGDKERAEKLHPNDDASDARWFDTRSIPKPAFDHDQIIRYAMKTVEQGRKGNGYAEL